MIIRELCYKPHLMSAENFNACLAVVLKEEGGFVNNPSDPGGMTNLGVTQRTWSDWIGHDATEAEMQGLTAGLVSPLYLKRYWEPMGCDNWPAGVDLSVFDFGVNAGPSRSIRTLQTACGANADGVLGPLTQAAVAIADARETIIKFADLREAYYRSLPTFSTFGNGWLNRVAYVRQQALGMVA